MNDKRVRVLREGVCQRPGAVAYWMSRDQRASDNWALLLAQRIALQHRVPLVVVFCLVPSFLGATMRQYGFMLGGLEEVERDLAEKDIPFYLVQGSPEEALPDFVKMHGIGVLVTDFDPLRIKRKWKEGVVRRVTVPFHEVDAHNIVPCWWASRKQEYAAHTFRPKVRRALPEFLDEVPPVKKHPYPSKERMHMVDWYGVRVALPVDRSIPEVDWVKPGEKAARQRMEAFLAEKLATYDESRNDPNRDGQSSLSPYLHFGHISAQRVAIEVTRRGLDRTLAEPFLEELIVRRELSDNFCFHNPRYDSVEGFPEWARRTLEEHRADRREYVYSAERFERAETHDELWNAAQRQMVVSGKMHGYMRMYWAKKILEWTESAEKALDVACYLNDRYELDGRDRNGYVGVAWSVGGVHDRAWASRAVFGKIRYMSYKGCRSKFDVDEYVARWSSVKPEPVSP